MAEIAIREATDAGLGTAEIDDAIIAPALWLVGELWERGEISVADEHIATEISIRVLALEREAQRVVEARAEQAAPTVRAVQQRWPNVRFVIGGSGLTSRTHSRPGMEVCRRVCDVVEAVEGMVRGGLN
jgi:B12 binding domain